MINNWKEIRLEEAVASLQAGNSVNGESRSRKDDEIGVLKVSAVTYGIFDPDAYKTVTDPSEIERLSVTPSKGTIIVSRANTSDLVGACAYVDKTYPYLILPDKLWKLSLRDDFSAKWLNYILSSKKIRSQISNRATGTSGSMKNISQKSFLSIRLLVPPLAEQRKIAEILGAWDEAIAEVAQLIAALQQRKKGLMQRLLTGQVRFPEFVGKRPWASSDEYPSDWMLFQLGSLGETFNGLTGKTKDDFGRGEKYIPYKNIFDNSSIDTNWFDYVEIKNSEKQNTVQYGDIFFTTSSETPHEVGMSSVLLENVDNCYLNSFCFGFRLHNFEKLLPEYARYLLRSSIFRKQMYKLAQGATRYNLSKRELLKVNLPLPSIAEQKSIARVLHIADNEIELLQQKYGALQKQKKGLMQRLLTGQIRVNTTHFPGNSEFPGKS